MKKDPIQISLYLRTVRVLSIYLSMLSTFLFLSLSLSLCMYVSISLGAFHVITLLIKNIIFKLKYIYRKNSQYLMKYDL